MPRRLPRRAPRCVCAGGKRGAVRLKKGTDGSADFPAGKRKPATEITTTKTVASGGPTVRRGRASRRASDAPVMENILADTVDSGSVRRDTHVGLPANGHETHAGFPAEEATKKGGGEGGFEPKNALPSPSSPPARHFADETSLRAKTPPTFEDVHGDETGTHDAALACFEKGLGSTFGDDAVAKGEKKQGTKPGFYEKRDVETEKKKSYPLAFLFPDGRLYDLPPARYHPPLEPPQNYQIPSDYIRLAVDVNDSYEIKRVVKLRAIRRIKEAAAGTHDVSPKRTRVSPEHKQDTSPEYPCYVNPEDILSDEDEEDDEDLSCEGLGESTDGDVSPARKKPKMTKVMGRPRLHRESGGSPIRTTTFGTRVGFFTIPTPVKGFRTSRGGGESAGAALGTSCCAFPKSVNTLLAHTRLTPLCCNRSGGARRFRVAATYHAVRGRVGCCVFHRYDLPDTIHTNFQFVELHPPSRVRVAPEVRQRFQSGPKGVVRKQSSGR